MKNVLIIQDISSFGKCSTTVALPIISACGVTGSILPTSLLSTHTGSEFPGFTFLDLFDNMQATLDHWKTLGIKFDAVYTGYLGMKEHVDLILDNLSDLLKEDALFFVDPAFADNGVLYSGFDEEYVQAMLRLCQSADYVLPNLSEACFLLDLDYCNFDPACPDHVKKAQEGLQEAGAKNVIITGVRQEDQIGASLLKESGETFLSLKDYLPQSFHGTGDVFTSVFVGKYLQKGSIEAGLDAAVDFVPEAIRQTLNDEDAITYGVHFEKCLHLLIQ